MLVAFSATGPREFPGFRERGTGFEHSPDEESREIANDGESGAAPNPNATPRPLDVSRAVDRPDGLPSDDPAHYLAGVASAAMLAGQWDVVKAALEELRALRLERAGPNVVPLDAKARGRR